MNVPLLDLKAQFKPMKNEMMAAVEEIFDTQYFILGPTVANFEKETSEYIGAKFALGVSSGTDALIIALMALDIKPGDEIITTPYTFFATAGSIARLGAIPVFVDIDLKTYNIDVSKIENAITEKTKAIIPVHLYGQCVDIDPIMAIAEKNNLFVVEDAAQAIGSKNKNRNSGTFGALGCFSFFPSKNLGGAGDGGLVTTNDEKLYEKLVKLRNHGSYPKYYHPMIGGNFRLDALQAAVLSIKLKHLNEWHEGRRKNAGFYDKAFSAVPKIVTPVILPENYSIYNQYVIRVPNRNQVIEKLREANIGCEIYYPVPLHLQECFDFLGNKEGDFPESEKAAKETIALPIYPELTDEQKQYVVDTVIEACNP